MGNIVKKKKKELYYHSVFEMPFIFYSPVTRECYCVIFNSGECFSGAEGQLKDSRQPHLAWHYYPSLAPSVLVSLKGKRGRANNITLVLFRALSVSMNGVTAAAAVPELAQGCR